MKNRSLLWLGVAAAAACSHQGDSQRPLSAREGDRTTVIATRGNDQNDQVVYQSQPQTAYRSTPSKKTVPKRDRNDEAAQARAKSFITQPGTHLDDSGNTVSNPVVSDQGASNSDDSGAVAPNATDQGNGERDLTLTQQIRRALMGDDSLSFGAKNVTVVTTDGKVTLRGNVSSNDERSTIDNYARRIAGERAVDNQIEVKP